MPQWVVSSKDFEVKFSKASGFISHYEFRGVSMIEQGPQPNFWRAPTDNDLGNGMHEWAAVWKDAGKTAVLQHLEVNRGSEKEFYH